MIRLGTRASALALAQARLVADRLGETEVVSTNELAARSGQGAAEPGGDPREKSRWVRELELALLRGAIDLAVHSAKDLPTTLPEGLALLAAPARAGAEDVLCGAPGVDALGPGARVGTSSLRREAQLRAARADVEVVRLAGNVDTRLRKLRERTEALDAIVLARAGLQRLGRAAEAQAVLDPTRFVPAPGQGTLALEGRAEDSRAGDAAVAVNDPTAHACLLTERAVARELGASCNTPIGVHAQLEAADRMRVRAWVGLPDGSEWLADELVAPGSEPEALAATLAGRLRAAGVQELLRGAEELAVGRA